MDLLLAFALLVLVFSSLSNLHRSRLIVAKSAETTLEAKVVGEKLAASINTVYANGPELELRIDLPEKIGGDEYSVSFDDSTREIVVKPSSGPEVKTGVVCNVLIHQLDPSKPIRIYWENDRVEVANV